MATLFTVSLRYPMFPIIQAKPQFLSDIYKMVFELAQYHGIEDKIKITESQLSAFLFCDQPNHFVGMSLVEGKLSGLVLFNFTSHNICANVTRGIYIENLYVTPNSRNQGIGRSLFNYVVDKALVNDCSRIEWWVSRENRKAAGFYKKLGAIELSEWNIFKCDRTAMNKLFSGSEL